VALRAIQRPIEPRLYPVADPSMRNFSAIWTRVSVLAGVSVIFMMIATPQASSQGEHLTVDFDGIGPLHWNMSLAAVGRELGRTFDCSQGAVPGTCLCEEGPASSTIAFSRGRLIALFTRSHSATTSRGVSIGARSASVVYRYPRARLVEGGLGGGLARFYLARHEGHALVFNLQRGRVAEIAAFANDDLEDIASELCA
jgi:hypothetical protein